MHHCMAWRFPSAWGGRDLSAFLKWGKCQDSWMTEGPELAEPKAPQSSPESQRDCSSLQMSSSPWRKSMEPRKRPPAGAKGPTTPVAHTGLG